MDSREVLFKIINLGSRIRIPWWNSLLQCLRLFNGTFQIVLHVTSTLLSLFGDRLEDATVDFICIYSCNGLDIGNLEWIHFVMINNELRLLIILNGSKGIFWNQNNEVSLIKSKFRKRQVFVSFCVLADNSRA